MQQIEQTPIFILCGGLGTRIKEETAVVPKPMVPIGRHPILWHIMRHYRRHGFRKFVLCLGFKAEIIKDYFLNYSTLNSDFTVHLDSHETHIHASHHEEDWEVTLAYTGEEAMTGARLAKAAKKYLGDAKHAAVTYGDGLTDVNLAEEFAFHLKHKKIGTVLGVNPPSRFGEIELEGSSVTRFQEKPRFDENWINGGYFFFRRSFFEHYLTTSDECVLEQQPLIQLAKDGELSLFKHRGFWAPMDTQRDRDALCELWHTGKAPWAPPLPSISIPSNASATKC